MQSQPSSQAAPSLFPSTSAPSTSQATSSIFVQPATSAPSISQPSAVAQPKPSTVGPSIPTSAPATSQAKPSTGPVPQNLEESKKQMLNKKRIQDAFNEWKSEIDTHYAKFKQLGDKTIEMETACYETQKELLILRETLDKIVGAHTQINDNLDMISSEQNDLNNTLDLIEKELDRVLEQSHITSTFQTSGADERENLYIKANVVRRNVEEIEANLSQVTKMLNESQDREASDVSGDVERTLDVYLETLNWIESNVYLLDSKINSLENDFKSKQKKV
jgi:chromosome segregation ATPase